MEQGPVSKPERRPAHIDLRRADAYGRSFADVYDLWYQDVSDPLDTARFIDRRSPPGPVLEVGVGSGRLAVPLAARGMTVIGLDGSAQMLRRCPPAGPAGSIALVLADMRSLPLNGTVGAALIAFNTLFNLGAEVEQQGLLIELRDLIGDNGFIVVEALDVSALLSGPRHSVGVRSTGPHGVVITATQLDQERQTLTGQHLEISGTGVSVRPWRLRWLTPAQLDALAVRAGLILTERFGTWAEDPFVDGSEAHISVYRRDGR